MRKIRIATVSFLIEDSPHTVEANLRASLEYIREASKNCAHVVCLPETVTTNNVKDAHHVAEDYPGEWTLAFSSAAKENGIAIVAPYYVKESGKQYNQATFFDKTGDIKGYYRKAQPTGWEARHVTPGDELPVIDLGFGKVAVMICMDIYFAEIARIYAMKGAEILFWPTTTHGPTQSGLEAQIRTRAMDNSLTIVESNLSQQPPYAPYKGRFYPGNARVVDHNGEIIAQTGHRPGIAYTDVDLDEVRMTQDCVLIRETDSTREDLEALARMDLYAREYAEIAKKQNRYYDSLPKKK